MKAYVFGATGTVGSPLVQSLLDNGHEVLAATRKPGESKTGLKYVDAGDPKAMAEADSVFLLSPGGLPDQYSVLKPYLDQARQQKPQKTVLMTAFGVEHAPPEAPMRKLELELLDSGLNATILRPNWFMQNFNTYWIHGILSDGKIYFPAGDAKTSFIDARDIGATAATVLTSTEYSGEALGLTGSEALDHSQVAAKISAATGKSVEYVNVDPNDFKASLKQAGLDADYVELLSGIAAALRDGFASPITDAVNQVLKRDPISFDQYAQDYATAWKG
ncbi:MAG: NmrA family NAD(P)-binding protein [Leptospiraceae bacterium]|nr:NmrA family NAD(P)-binding protein [Leptospiraceae bacterium]